MTKMMSTEQFIARARKVHGRKFRYEKVVYTGPHNKIIITCPKHGDFEQQAWSHLQGSGCKECKREKHIKDISYNTDIFVKKAKAVHGRRYDYSKVDYKGSQVPVIIICNKHGEFKQRPSDHLKGHGCKWCNNSQDYKKIGTKRFIERARKVHGNKYDYSKVEYVNINTLVTIICKKHGEFKQRPGDHTKKGYGCPYCANELRGSDRKLTTEEFIEKAKAVHGNFYNYSKVKYVNSKTKVVIICPKHGAFEQSPNAHLHGYGCIECGFERTANDSRLTKEEFISKARLIHSNKYDYSKVKYVRNDVKVIITCPKHGDFEQKPMSHLVGQGCKHCRETKGEKLVEKYLQDHCLEYSAEKIVRSQFSPNKRKFFKVDFYLPQKNVIIEYNGIQHYIPIPAMGGDERFIHRQIRDSALKRHCEAMGIGLIVIPYFEIENIDEILHTELNNYNWQQKKD